MFEDWVTIEEAVQRTRISERTFHRMIQAKDIQRQYRREPGKKPRIVLDPDKVKTLEGQLMHPIPTGEPLPVRMPPDPDKVPLPTKMNQSDMVPLVTGFAQALAAEFAKLPQFQAPALPKAPPTDLWLSFKDALEYSGLPRDYLREQCEAHTIEAFRLSAKGRWHIKRESLERHNAARDDDKDTP